ncbi:MAG TPA: transglycosylase domain-containing protein [Patescibacteria group bacterium]
MNFPAWLKDFRSAFTKKKLQQLVSKDFWWKLIKRNRRRIFLSIGILLLIIILVPIFTYIYFAGDLKDKQSITSYNRTGLTLMDDQGKVFFTFSQPKEVTYIPISDIPKSAQDAAVTAEDRDFYTNPGFSINGMIRAFGRNLLAGKIVEGGSTISQELIKNALLNSNRNFLRKYQELVLATELNRRFSKQDILEMYLNSVYFGEGAFGIENAAKTYFGVHAKDLTLAQSALLISILPAPSAYSPLSNNPEISQQLMNQLLTQMISTKYISQAQADQASQEKLVYQRVSQEPTNTLAPHFALYVKDLLFKKFGEDRVIREGFRVKTTLNSTWQQYAEQVVKNQILYLKYNKATNGATVAMDPATGNVKVMVGSHDWNDPDNGKINMAIHPRQPGSSFKPIIYGDALEKKVITLNTTLHDSPISYGDYKPLDYDKRFRGPVTVRRALANSLNIPAIEVMNKLGISAGLNDAKNFGISTLNKNASDYGLPLVLGSGEVPLLEMTAAYAVFADQGIYHQPNAILEIKNKYDQTVDQPTNTFSLSNFFSLFNPQNIMQLTQSNQPRTVIGDGTAYLISSILSDNNARAEEFGGALTISRPAAVKTGTTSDFKDALTIGYTPSLVIGVWVGNNDNTPMDNIAGSLGAAPIWRLLMEDFLRNTPLETFIQPPSVQKIAFCLSPTPGELIASASGTEYFLRGTEPDACPTPTLLPSPTPKPTDKPAQPTSQPTTAAPNPTDIPPTSIPTTTAALTPVPSPTGAISLPPVSPTIHL